MTYCNASITAEPFLAPYTDIQWVDSTVTSPTFAVQNITGIVTCNPTSVVILSTLDGGNMILSGTAPSFTVSPTSPAAHTKYQFQIELQSKASPPIFTTMQLPVYTLLYGCPQAVIDLDPSILPWNLTTTNITFDFYQGLYVYSFNFPTKFTGPSQCTHSWKLYDIVDVTPGATILNGDCGPPSSTCTQFKVQGTMNILSKVQFKFGLISV